MTKAWALLRDSAMEALESPSNQTCYFFSSQRIDSQRIAPAASVRRLDLMKQPATWSRIPKRSIELNLQRALTGDENLFYDQTTFGNYSDRSARLAAAAAGGSGGTGGGGGSSGNHDDGGGGVSGGGDGEEGPSFPTDFSMVPAKANVLPLQAWGVYRKQVRYVPTDHLPALPHAHPPPATCNS